MARTGFEPDHATPVAASADPLGAERTAQLSRIDQMRDYFSKQPKETIRVPKEKGEQYVQVNGYTFVIAPGIPVKVPEQIADMLRTAEII